MRRSSKSIKLTLLASVTALSLLTGCDDDKDKEIVSESQVFPDLSSCLAVLDNAEVCQSGNAAAEEEFRTTDQSLIFDDMASCEVSGQVCTEAQMTTGETVFVPAVAGFMIGWLASGAYNATPLRYGPSPDCQKSGNNCSNGSSSAAGSHYLYAHGAYFGSSNGSRVGGGMSVSRSGSAMGAVSRGGFGESAAGHAGGGE